MDERIKAIHEALNRLDNIAEDDEVKMDVWTRRAIRVQVRTARMKLVDLHSAISRSGACLTGGVEVGVEDDYSKVIDIHGSGEYRR